jgi:PBP1b-binding outer membrane lipoprotein LpoB
MQMETKRESQENLENQTQNLNVQELLVLSKMIDFTHMIKRRSLIMERISEYLTKHQFNLPLVAKLLEILMLESLETL